jgi:hypothetical protein
LKIGLCSRTQLVITIRLPHGLPPTTSPTK